MATRKPTSRALIDSLPIIPQTDRTSCTMNATCAICTNEYFDHLGEATVTQLPCHHYFHRDCIITWLKRANTCPLCRHEMPVDDQDKLGQQLRLLETMIFEIFPEEEASYRVHMDYLWDRLAQLNLPEELTRTRLKHLLLYWLLLWFRKAIIEATAAAARADDSGGDVINIGASSTGNTTIHTDVALRAIDEATATVVSLARIAGIYIRNPPSMGISSMPSYIMAVLAEEEVIDEITATAAGGGASAAGTSIGAASIVRNWRQGLRRWHRGIVSTFNCLGPRRTN